MTKHRRDNSGYNSVLVSTAQVSKKVPSTICVLYAKVKVTISDISQFWAESLIQALVSSLVLPGD